MDGEPREQAAPGVDLFVTPARPPVAEALIDQVVVELNILHTRATLETAIEMGRLIVARFYDGDLTAWREHRASEISFRRLAARAERDLDVSATNLYRAVALYELTDRLRIDRDSSLTMTHLRTVVGLPEDNQTALLASAERLHWTTERLEREAATVRATLCQRKGRRPAPPPLRAAQRVARTWRRIEEAFADEAVQKLSLPELESLHRTVDEVRLWLEQLARRLAGALRPPTSL
jgi:hypothetical protein